jgi:peptide chain release factor 2
LLGFSGWQQSSSASRIYRSASTPLGGFFDVGPKSQRLVELDDATAQSDFWKDRASAEVLTREAEQLRKFLERFSTLQREAAALAELLTESKTAGHHELESAVADLESQLRDLETEALLSGPYDARDAIVAVHAGTGGVDAQDWAGMLLRMILRYCERQGYRTRMVDENRSPEAGIKSATFEVKGEGAYGHLKSENGVHRLVRISPFDAEKMRHTSFALVEVLPALPAVEAVALDPKDLRIDTFLSSGHGGQSVQTTYSAVRVVHLPTKITVSVQNERSQQQNRETALKILAAKLKQRELEKQQAEKQRVRGAYSEAAWGNQIRSYVLQPYTLVKDHRTKVETANVSRVLDGDLDAFVDGFLTWTAERTH